MVSVGGRGRGWPWRWWFGYLLLLWGLVAYGGRGAVPMAAASPWLPKAAAPTWADDLDRDSLRLALHSSLEYISRLPPERALPFGNRQITATMLRQTLEAFQQVLAQQPSPKALATALRNQFTLVQAAGTDGKGEMLVTGYYEITLEGSLVPTTAFTYPLYSRPPDLLDIDLAPFHPRLAGERIVARFTDGKLLPYFSRREIDSEGRLRGQGLELVWLRDAIDGFFLHLQGSGRIHLRDGRSLQVQYVASNGHPYASIGRLILDEQRLPPEMLSMQSLQQYLREHPQERERILNHNSRYIFFHQVPHGPRGSLAVPLVAGRSIATDARLFPPAGLAFLQTHKPILDHQGIIIGWQPLSRFVFNHDTGSAITGPGRIDLFWGSGAAAETAAGRMQHPGQLFFLLKRPPPSRGTGR